jgi:hypothetical protein
MKEYRIIENNGKFTPQYKNGWKTFWNWRTFLELGSIVYLNTPFEDSWKKYVNVVFFDLDKAKLYIKNLQKKDIFKIHKIEKMK